MKRRMSLALGTLIAAIPAGLAAQTLRCPGGSPGSLPLVAQDACQQAYDVYQLIAPQLGLSLAGGNATAGTGNVLGGIGHFSVGVRANVLRGLLPDVNAAGFSQSITGAQSRTLPTKTDPFGLPTADAAIGLFKGFPLALTNVLGLDALVSGEYVPSITKSNFSLDPSSNFKFGFGARVGLLSESIAFPAVSVTWIERDLPTTDVTATSGSNGGTTLGITGMTVKTQAWRIVASKSLIAFGLAAGIGRDAYDQSARITGSVAQAGFVGRDSISASQKLNRTNIFVDLSLNLPILKLVAEVGEATGGSVDTFNSFSGGRADRSLAYASLGLRLSR